MDAAAQLAAAFAFSQGLQPMGWCHHSQVGSSQEPDLEASSQTHAELCLISDFRCCEIGVSSVGIITTASHRLSFRSSDSSGTCWAEITTSVYGP